MKIIPKNFKITSKFLRSKISSQIKQKIPSTMINDFLSRAYGWNHYHELKKSEKKSSIYKQEFNLTSKERLDLSMKIIYNLTLMVHQLERTKDKNSITKCYHIIFSPKKSKRKPPALAVGRNF